VLCAFLLASASPSVDASSTGELQLRWDVPADPSGIDGHRVYYSPVSGDYAEASFVQVPDGSLDTVRVEQLEDCRSWYFVVRSYNAWGESANSVEVGSWPRTRIDPTPFPRTVRPGEVRQLQLTGSNFRTGDTCQVEGMQCQLSIIDCRTAVANVTVPADAAVGSRALLVRHAGSGVEGTVDGAIEVVVDETPPDDDVVVVDDAAPTVLSALPRSGSTTAVTEVHPAVWFSEPVSLEQAAIELRDAWGTIIPVDVELTYDTRIRIRPRVSLEYGTPHTLEVRGVLDRAGNLQDTPWLQDFSTEPDPMTTELGTPSIAFDGPSGEDIVWLPTAGAQYFEVSRCIANRCSVVQNTEARFPSVFDRSFALGARHQVGLDGVHLTEGDPAVEFVNVGRRYDYRVRACKVIDGLEYCGPYSNKLHYRGQAYMCIEDSAEIPCYPGAETVKSP
jgi:hypothetical protein